MNCKLNLSKSAIKALNKLPKEDKFRCVRIITSLKKNPRPKNSIKMKNSQFYRIRLGDYRVIYDIQDKQLIVLVLKVGHRKDVYQKK